MDDKEARWRAHLANEYATYEEFERFSSDKVQQHSKGGEVIAAGTGTDGKKEKKSSKKDKDPDNLDKKEKSKKRSSKKGYTELAPQVTILAPQVTYLGGPATKVGPSASPQDPDPAPEEQAAEVADTDRISRKSSDAADEKDAPAQASPPQQASPAPAVEENDDERLWAEFSFQMHTLVAASSGRQLPFMEVLSSWHKKFGERLGLPHLGCKKLAALLQGLVDRAMIQAFDATAKESDIVVRALDDVSWDGLCRTSAQLREARLASLRRERVEELDQETKKMQKVLKEKNSSLAVQEQKAQHANTAARISGGHSIRVQQQQLEGAIGKLKTDIDELKKGIETNTKETRQVVSGKRDLDLFPSVVSLQATEVEVVVKHETQQLPAVSDGTLQGAKAVEDDFM